MIGRTTTAIYDEINSYRDAQTGEIIESARKQVVKRENTPDFVMLFTQGLSLLTKSNLTNAEAATLFEVLKYTVNNSNMVMLSPDVRNLIVEESKLKKRTVDQNIQSLVKKKILIKKKSTFFLNPVMFGRGKWTDIKKLTQSLEIEYDFQNLTAIEKIKTKVLYNEAGEIEDIPHEVIQTKEYKDEDGVINQEITIAESQKNIHQNQQTLSFDEPKQNLKDELALVNARNEEMKLKLELHNKGLL